VRHSLDSMIKTASGDTVNAIKPGHESFAPDGKTFRHIWVRSSWLHQAWLEIWPSYNPMRMHHDRDQSTEVNANSPNTPENSEQITVGSLLSWMPPTRASGQGRPDLAWELREWVVGKQDQAMGKDKSVCVVVSGPDGMVRDVRNACADLVREGWRVKVHVEKFGW